MPNLSKRLLTIASLVPSGARVCDVGADHGYLSIYIAKHKNPISIITTDINEKPLSHAKINIEKESIKNIDLRLCDGLDGISLNESDTFIIAGMGGEVISGIIERGIEKVKNSTISLILQPTTSPEFLRQFLYQNGFEIKKEIPVYDNNKLYSVMKVCFTGKVQNKSEYIHYIGLLTPETEEGALYINKQYNRCLKCAQKLEKTDKTQEYSYYKSVCDGIEEFLKEF